MVICASGHNHEDLKRDAARWAQLHYVGMMVLGRGDALELRNCTCGSTLAVQVDAEQAEVAA
jgi:hypothetical protein